MVPHRQLPLPEWDRRSFGTDGLNHLVYERGSGTGVILLPELPGITPQVHAFADSIVESGFRVTLPSLTGVDGGPLTGPRLASSMARLCVSREFRAFAVGSERPFTAWLRALCGDVATRTNSRRVGVIGMCFTGGFALAAAADPRVAAAVVSQPSLPMPISLRRRRDLGLSADEEEAVASRAAAGEFCALGLRFSHDQASPRERFARMRTLLGEALQVIEIDSEPGNAHGISPRAHTVLTHESTEGGPLEGVHASVVGFLRQHL